MQLRKPLTIAAIACIAVAATFASAQKDPSVGAAPRVELFNVDFKGGSVTEYIDALRRASGQANIVLMNNLSSIPMPAVRLTSVDVASALQMLEWIPRRQEDAEIKVSVRMAAQSAETSPVYTVMAEIEPRHRPASSRTVVFAVSDLLQENVKVTDVLTAIETAVGMIKDQPAAQIRFHESTGLLIAHGRPEQIDSIHQVITQMRERIEQRRHRDAMDHQNVVGHLHAELEQCRSRVNDQERIIQQLRQQLGQAQ